MAKQKNHYECGTCGYKAPKWMGQCPGCGSWDGLEIQADVPRVSGTPRPVNIVDYQSVAPEKLVRFSSGFAELDRVLGGGFVPGSLLLVGGEPGIGKSTLMLQAAAALGQQGKSVLYLSGEESQAQIKMRGERLNLKAPDLMLMTETCLRGLGPGPGRALFRTWFLWTVFRPCSSAICPPGPGSVTQVREITTRLLTLAKTKGNTVILVGHITKEGNLAGPKTLEHMVDGVFYFEGDKYHRLRLLRSQKNRFGPSQELGIFQMAADGLFEVPNPSQVLLDQRPKSCAGSLVVPCIEGSRPLMVEVQVLLSSSTYASPRRVTMGVDGNRLALIMAVLEKNAGLQLQGLDVFVNVVGGISIQEPAIDLALALAVYSSFRNLAFPPEVAVFGEVGLAGEVRSVSEADLRIKECKSLGFTRIICPKANHSQNFKNVTISGVGTLVEALEQAL